jgi:hypothetical protein
MKSSNNEGFNRGREATPPTFGWYLSIFLNRARRLLELVLRHHSKGCCLLGLEPWILLDSCLFGREKERAYHATLCDQEMIDVKETLTWIDIRLDRIMILLALTRPIAVSAICPFWRREMIIVIGKDW